MTAEEYQAQLQALLPKGDALTRELEADLSDLILALADELARVDRRASDLLEEVDPRATQELITDWERVTGFPDPCSGLGETLGARRNDVVRRLTLVGSLTRQFLLTELAALGFTIDDIVEYEPAEVGHSQVGDELADEGVWFFFDVVTDAVAVFEPELGAITVGEPLGAIVNDTLECHIDRLKPAHTNYRLVPPP